VFGVGSFSVSFCAAETLRSGVADVTVVVETLDAVVGDDGDGDEVEGRLSTTEGISNSTGGCFGVACTRVMSLALDEYPS